MKSNLSMSTLRPRRLAPYYLSQPLEKRWTLGERMSALRAGCLRWVDVVEKGRDPIAVPLDAAWVD
jgi:hypothetical protein